MNLSIVIVYYYTGRRLSECLPAVYEFASRGVFETIVVDNASTDGSIELLKSSFLRVKLIANDTNLGWAKAANLGIRHSSGQYLLIITPGTLVTEGLIDKLLIFLEETPEAGAVGPAEILDGTRVPIYTQLDS